jgi:Ca2+-binding EF-hand superfamily protein
VTSYEIYRFMRDTLNIAVPLSEAESVIREFDGNLDNRLSFSEFAQLALPATSYSLRDIALKRPNAAILSYSYKYTPLHYTTLRQVGELLEQEMRFLRTRSELRRELIRHDDFVKSRYFDLLSLGKAYITVDDLIYFLNKNGQRTATEDLEAILRRCDHTGDQTLNYTEFSEVTAYTDEPYNAGASY